MMVKALRQVLRRCQNRVIDAKVNGRAAGRTSITVVRQTLSRLLKGISGWIRPWRMTERIGKSRKTQGWRSNHRRLNTMSATTSSQPTPAAAANHRSRRRTTIKYGRTESGTTQTVCRPIPPMMPKRTPTASQENDLGALTNAYRQSNVKKRAGTSVMKESAKGRNKGERHNRSEKKIDRAGVTSARRARRYASTAQPTADGKVLNRRTMKEYPRTLANIAAHQTFVMISGALQPL